MKILTNKLYALLKLVIQPLLIKKSKKNKISLKQKIKLLLIHKFYSNYQPMTLYNWTEKNSKRNVDDRLELIKDQLIGSNVLDIGSHSGYFSLKLAQKGYFVVGVDQDRVILDKANLVKKKI